MKQRDRIVWAILAFALLVITFIGLTGPATVFADASIEIMSRAKPLLSVNSSVTAQGIGPHGGYAPATDECAACHRTHTGQGIGLLVSRPEESVCFVCHNGTGATTDIESIILGNPSSPTAFYNHPVDQTVDVHNLMIFESNPGEFGGANRHVECTDCHNPHSSAPGATNPPAVQTEMDLMSGVDPLYNGAGPPSGYSWQTTAQYEYQVCLKCHSSFTTLPAYIPDGWDGANIVSNGLPKLTSSDPDQILDSRDMAQEFNPNNLSYHPVMAQGTNQNIPANSFVNGWSQTSLVYCSDCHTNAGPGSQGSGPHGSPRLHILDGQANYSTVSVEGSNFIAPDQELCFNCHNYQTYVTGQNQDTNFRDHEKHMSEGGITCYACHDTHGSEQLHLINIDVSQGTILDGRNSQTAWFFNQNQNRAGCYVDCHGKKHDPKTYRP